MGLFGKPKPPDPKEEVQKWSSAIRKEGYKLDRSINNIRREEEKVKRSIKEAAKRNQKDVCLVLAKELVQSHKGINRLYAAKAHMNSVQMNMKNQLSVLRISGALEKSTEVMQSMQKLVKMEELSETMRELSKEMMQAGIIEEMLEDTMEGALGGDDDEMEEAAQQEVDKILFELTEGTLGKAPAAHTGSLPMPAMPQEEDEEEDLSVMKARLEALRS